MQGRFYYCPIKPVLLTLKHISSSYSCNEGKIQEFRHALVFNHSCIAKLYYHVSESEQHKHVTDVKLDLTVMHLDRIPLLWGLFISEESNCTSIKQVLIVLLIG